MPYFRFPYILFLMNDRWSLERGEYLLSVLFLMDHSMIPCSSSSFVLRLLDHG